MATPVEQAAYLKCYPDDDEQHDPATWAEKLKLFWKITGNQEDAHAKSSLCTRCGLDSPAAQQDGGTRKPLMSIHQYGWNCCSSQCAYGMPQQWKSWRAGYTADGHDQPGWHLQGSAKSPLKYQPLAVKLQQESASIGHWRSARPSGRAERGPSPTYAQGTEAGGHKHSM